MSVTRMDWTDERLDDFRGEVTHRFDEVDRRFDEVDKRFERVELDIREFRTEMNNRFDSMQRTMLQSTVLVLVALIGLIATQL